MLMSGEAGKLRILLIEDDPAVSAIIRTALQRAGHEVCVARRPEECLDLSGAHAIAFDLLLSDVVLDGRGAGPLLNQLQRISPGTPVLMISGYPLHLLVEQGYLGPDAVDHCRSFFLQKPFLPSELTATVNRVIATNGRRCSWEPEDEKKE